jgi:hypothetical protein
MRRPGSGAPRFPTSPHIGHEARILRRMVRRARGSEARYQTTATRIHERILRDLTVLLGRAKDEFTTPHLALQTLLTHTARHDTVNCRRLDESLQHTYLTKAQLDDKHKHRVTC